MRFYYLSNSLIPSKFANSIQVMKMCRAFSDYVKEVVLFARFNQQEKDVDIFQYYGVDPTFEADRIKSLDISGLRRFHHAWKIIQRIRADKGPKELFGRDYYVLGLIAFLGLIKAPMSLEIHQPPSKWLHTFLQRQVFKSPHFKQLVVISQALADEYARLFGPLVAGKTIVAHDGADTNQIPRDLIDNPSYEQKSSKFKLGYIGSFYPGKGMGMIAKLAPLLPDCEFHVVGGKPYEVEHWKQVCGQDNMVFHGFVSPERIYEFMREFDVMLAPYQPKVLIGGKKGSKKGDIAKWMSPLKLFEYMAGGKPIVCSDLPVLMEVLRDGDNALLASSTDADNWVAQIRKLKDSAELREHVGRNAQKDFFDNYTWKKRAEHILGIKSDSTDTKTNTEPEPEIHG